MRKPKYHSPTSIQKFLLNREEYFEQYLADRRPPRMAQTSAMAAGSAFDAYVKTAIEEFLGKKHSLEQLFEAQVEEQCRAEAWPLGQRLFDAYAHSGALADLMRDLSSATDIRLEFTVESEVSGVNLLGKPDLAYKLRGLDIIRDWKVNGACSKWGASPKKGYVQLRDSDGNIHGSHKDSMPMDRNGVLINGAHFLEDVYEDWARQLAIYAWLIGYQIGSPFVVGIEQIVCHPDRPIKVATHNARISGTYQTDLMDAIIHMQKAIDTGHIFQDLTPEENDEKCMALNSVYRAYEGTGANQEWFNQNI